MKPEEKQIGLVCRYCGCRHFYVVYTRQRPGKLMRRRQCRNCGARFTTWEKDVGGAKPAGGEAAAGDVYG